MAGSKRATRPKRSATAPHRAPATPQDDPKTRADWAELRPKDAAPRLRIRRYGATSATIRRDPSPTTAPAQAHKSAPIDLIVQALAEVTGALDPNARSSRDAPHTATAARPFAWLDALTAAQTEALFPYPSSPRLDDIGQGRRVAEDGSPGLPPSWLRWLSQASLAASSGVTRTDAVSARGAATDATAETNATGVGAQVATLAIERVARRTPSSWRIYREFVTSDDPSCVMTAMRLRIAPALARRAVARMRAALVTEIAYLSGLIDAQDTAATQDALTLYAAHLAPLSTALPTTPPTRPGGKPDARGDRDMR